MQNTKELLLSNKVRKAYYHQYQENNKINMYVARNVAKSQLLAFFTGLKRAHRRPKLLWKTKTWTNIILKVQLSKKAGLINKKTCLAFPYLHPCVAIMKEVYSCFFDNDNPYFHNGTLHIAIKKIRFCFGVMKYDSRAYE